MPILYFTAYNNMKKFNEKEIDPIVQNILRDLEEKYTKQKYDDSKSSIIAHNCPSSEVSEINATSRLVQNRIMRFAENSYGYSVPASKLGVIIGKNGDNIRFIAEQSNTKLDISPYNDIENPHLRTINLEGDIECVQKAAELLETSIKTFQYHLVGSISNPGAIFQSNHITLNIPNSIVGTLLGKQSETLLKVHSKYGVQMALLKDEEIVKGSMDRPLLISGRNKYIAKNEIESLIEKAKMSTVNFLDKNYKEEKIVRKYNLDSKLKIAFNKSFKLSIERKNNLIIDIIYEEQKEINGVNHLIIKGRLEDIEKAEREMNIYLKGKDIKLTRI